MYNDRMERASRKAYNHFIYDYSLSDSVTSVLMVWPIGENLWAHTHKVYVPGCVDIDGIKNYDEYYSLDLYKTHDYAKLEGLLWLSFVMKSIENKAIRRGIDSELLCLIRKCMHKIYEEKDLLSEDSGKAIAVRTLITENQR